MKKPELAKRLARHEGVSPAEAADRLDRFVHQVLSNLRAGKEAPLPGLGKFKQASNGKLSFQRERSGRHA